MELLASKRFWGVSVLLLLFVGIATKAMLTEKFNAKRYEQLYSINSYKIYNQKHFLKCIIFVLVCILLSCNLCDRYDIVREKYPDLDLEAPLESRTTLPIV